MNIGAARLIGGLVMAFALALELAACGGGGSSTSGGTAGGGLAPSVGGGGGGGGGGGTTGQYTIGGTINAASGIVGPGLKLTDNLTEWWSPGGASTPAPVPFTFSLFKFSTGASYVVTVTTQPTGQTCTITNASGVMGTANVTNILVDCI